MQHKRVALVTGANQGVGLQVAKELVAAGVTVLAGSRNFERGEAAAKEIGPGAIALQLDVTDRVSIATAARNASARSSAASTCWLTTQLSQIRGRAACPSRSTGR
jgi:NAD(P)-dependent dehydrogenase (short-subunit alcohol dehydrogenase family)